MHVNVFWVQVQGSLAGKCFILILVFLMAFYRENYVLMGLSNTAISTAGHVCSKFAITLALFSDVFDVGF